MVKRVEQEIVTEIKKCRACDSVQLKEALNLGIQYVSDFLLPNEQEIRAPLVLLRCEVCGLVQLSHSVNPDLMYSHFWYQSGISSSMRSSLLDVIRGAMTVVSLEDDDIVIDIGSNDGTLLSLFPSPPQLYKAGFEPAKNVAEISRQKHEAYIFNEYFNSESFLKWTENKAKLITAIAMFYDLEDPRKFLVDIARCLREDGVFIIQMNYLGSMLQNRTFDNICHEHLEYYSLLALENLLVNSNANLEVFRVEVNEVNGGSFRAYIGFKGQHGIHDSVSSLHIAESKMGLMTDAPYEIFTKQITQIKNKLLRLVSSKFPKKVYVLGASTRGNTLLQTCGLDHVWIKGAVDKNPEKWGRRTVGTNIPIMSRKDAGNPDFFLVLPYHFLEEFEEQERLYLHDGGKFIVPIPEPRIWP